MKNRLIAHRTRLAWVACVGALGGCAGPGAADSEFYALPLRSRATAWDTLRNDAVRAPGALARDVATAGWNRDFFLVVGGAWLVGEVVGKSGGDDAIETHIMDEDVLSQGANEFFDDFGGGVTLWAGAASFYAYGLASEDPRHRRASQDVLRSLATASVLTGALKVLIDDDRPNGERYGFPSGHSAAAMSVAASLDKTYGHRVGVPFYLLAAGTALQRLDDSAHDLDDVLGGLALGFFVGRLLTRGDELEVLGAQLSVVADPVDELVGLGLSWSF